MMFSPDDIEVKCDFESVLTQGKMYLFFMNRDIFWTSPHPNIPSYSNRAYTYYRRGHETADADAEGIFNLRRNSCYMEVKPSLLAHGIAYLIYLMNSLT